jgi:hypothetical protein
MGIPGLNQQSRTVWPTSLLHHSTQKQIANRPIEVDLISCQIIAILHTFDLIVTGTVPYRTVPLQCCDLHPFTAKKRFR